MQKFLFIMLAVANLTQSVQSEPTALQAKAFLSVRSALGLGRRKALQLRWLKQLKEMYWNEPIILKSAPFWLRWTAVQHWATPMAFADDISSFASAAAKGKQHKSYHGKIPVFGPYYDGSRPLHDSKLKQESQAAHRGAAYSTSVSLQSMHELLPWSQGCSKANTTAACTDHFTPFMHEMSSRCLPGGALAAATPVEISRAATKLGAQARQQAGDAGDEGADNSTPPHPPGWRYLTADLDNILSRTAQAARLHPLAPLLAVNPSASSLNMWVGPAGVTSPAHYDGDFNVYVQVSGLKRFYLWPPGAWHSMRPYPFLHPMHAQASVNVSKAPHTLDGAVVADLAPGNMLLLPAGWWHEVVAVTDSVSINVWSAASGTQATTDAIFQLTAAYYTSATQAKVGSSRDTQGACAGDFSTLRLVLRVLSLGMKGSHTPADSRIAGVTASGVTSAEVQDAAIGPCGAVTRSWLSATVTSRFHKPQLRRGLGCEPCSSQQSAAIAAQVQSACVALPAQHACGRPSTSAIEYMQAAGAHLAEWPADLVDTLAGNWLEYTLAIQHGARSTACALSCVKDS